MIGSPTLQVRLSTLRTCATTSTFSQVAPCRGGESKAKVKGNETPPPDEGEEKGGLLIWDLWMQGTDSIHNMRVVNTDDVSYQSSPPLEVPGYD